MTRGRLNALRRLLSLGTAPWRAPSDADVARELADHLELETEDRGDAGPAGHPGYHFGNRAAAMEATREVWRWVWLDQLTQDVRHGLRSLLRSPVYALASIITLACGIGAVTVAFSFTDAVFRHAFPLLPQDRLLWVAEGSTSCPSCSEFSPAAFETLRARARAMTGVVGTATWRTSFTRVPGQGSELVDGYLVSPDLFTTISAPFALGRGFRPDDGAPGQPDVAVVSFDFWSRQLGGSTTVIDSAITLGGEPRRVVGVLAAGVVFPTTADVYAPLVFDATQANDHVGRYLTVFARLAPGGTLASAQLDANAVARQLAGEAPKTDADWSLHARPLGSYHTDDIAIMQTLIDIAVLLVFLAGCLSVANLTLARAAARRAEMALRAALGGRRGRLARHLVVEALMLGLVGGALGIAAALAGIYALRHAMPPTMTAYVPGWTLFGLNERVLAFTFVASMGAVVVFAGLPVARATRVDLASVLSDGGRLGGGGVYGTRARATFVIIEVSVTLVLLTGATLLGRSVHNMVGGDPGVRRDHALAMHFTLERGLSDSAARDVYRRLDAALHAEPGVLGAGVSSTTPLSNNWWGIAFTIPGRATELNGDRLTANDQRVSPDYLRASGVRLISGRPLEARDAADAPRVVVVSKMLSQAMWPEESALGRTMIIDSVPWTVVGVATDVRHGGFDEPMRFAVYRSVEQAASRGGDLFIWTAGDPAAMRSAVGRVVGAVDPAAGIGDVETMRELEARHVSPFRMMAGLLGILAGVTMVIAVVGLYGVVAYGVAQRRREIGVRIAVGAQRRDIVIHVAGSAVRLTSIGILIGGAGALAFARLLGSLLYGVQATDPGTPLGAAATLLGIALLAALLPAWRAARIDPVVALRD